MEWENVFAVSVSAQGMSQGQTLLTPQQQQPRVSPGRTTGDCSVLGSGQSALSWRGSEGLSTLKMP